MKLPKIRGSWDKSIYFIRKKRGNHNEADHKGKKSCMYHGKWAEEVGLFLITGV